MNRHADIIQRDLERLGIGVDIRREGDALPSEWNVTADDLSMISSGEVCEISGRLYLKSRNSGRIFSCDKALQGGKNLIRMAAMLFSNYSGGAERAGDALGRILEGQCTGAEAEAVLKKHGLTQKYPKQVILMRIPVSAKDAYGQIEELIPLQNGDVLVEINEVETALVRTAQDEDELVQYAEALQDTFMTETGQSMDIGIGNAVPGFLQARESYLQAREALNLGEKFSQGHKVHVYHQLTLERFLASIPRETAVKYLRELFNHSTEKVLGDEMMETVETFFLKDLNLSDTSRQMTMHRNTLVYRLDKIQKATGLDLRHFEDAVLFKVMMELKNLHQNMNESQ